MDAASFRSIFENFLGTERFVKFVRQGAVPRLLYWQEREWDRFIEKHPEFASALPQLEVLLRFCFLHRQELVQDRIEVLHSTVRYNDAYMAEQKRLFPYANAAPYITNGRAYPDDTIEVWHCPHCRQFASRYTVVKED